MQPTDAVQTEADSTDRFEELSALLALTATPGLGLVRIRKLLAKFGSGRAIWAAPEAERNRVARVAFGSMSDRAKRHAGAVLAACRSSGVAAIGWSEKAYPQALRTIHDPPIVLYVRGSLPDHVCAEPAALRSIAIVGTRDASARARGYAEALGRELGAAGASVVSGLALGIDGAAHRGALAAGAAPPVAVLAGGLDQIRPAIHNDLAAQILAAGGALVAEDPPGLRPQGHNFVARNRIVSGLSRGVVIVEAGARSGALHTAEFAMDQGRTVFVVPDHPTATRALGNLRLLADGATPVIRLSDVTEAFGWDSPSRTPEVRHEAATMIARVGQRAPCTLDQLPGDPVANMVLLGELEMDGFLDRDGSGSYRLTHAGRSVFERVGST